MWRESGLLVTSGRLREDCRPLERLSLLLTRAFSLRHLDRSRLLIGLSRLEHRLLSRVGRFFRCDRLRRRLRDLLLDAISLRFFSFLCLSFFFSLSCPPYPSRAFSLFLSLFSLLGSALLSSFFLFLCLFSLLRSTLLSSFSLLFCFRLLLGSALLASSESALDIAAARFAAFSRISSAILCRRSSS